MQATLRRASIFGWIPRPVGRLFASASVIFALGSTACAEAPESAPRPTGPDPNHLPRVVDESSGLETDPGSPGGLWTHGDSGTDPVLFAVDARGALRGQVEIEGSARDWEDLTWTPDHMVVGDTGNNFNRRKHLQVLLLEREALEALPKKLAPVRSIEFRYPDQDAFPPAKMNFDAEALVWAHDHLWLLTKHRADTRTTLYRFADLEQTMQTLERISDFDVGGAEHPYGGRVSAADVDDAERRLVVLTYHALFLFPLDPARPEDLLAGEPMRIDIVGSKVGQCEGVVFAGDELIVGNEFGRLFRLPLSQLADGATWDGETLTPPKAAK